MGAMAAARGQKALVALPQLVKSLRSDPVSGSARLRHLPSLRRTFSLYDQINLIDSVPEDELRFQSYAISCRILLHYYFHFVIV
ncbi:hypothetical protein ZEAMMB73_Zm00001d030019 [Zea mays]|nr:hypothetical protein ZEAMMB73_Zm00001d030019 [Zea mays]